MIDASPACARRRRRPSARPHRSRTGERRTKVVSVAQDRQPGQAGLEALEAQLLEQAGLVGDREATLAVVVGAGSGAESHNQHGDAPSSPWRIPLSVITWQHGRWWRCTTTHTRQRRLVRDLVATGQRRGSQRTRDARAEVWELVWRAGAPFHMRVWPRCSPSPPRCRVPRLGNAPRVTANAHVAGAVPDTTELHVTVTLPVAGPAGLAALADAVSNPGSPQYHDYISGNGIRAAGFGQPRPRSRPWRLPSRSRPRPGTGQRDSLSIPVTATAGAGAGVLDLVLARRAASGASAIVNGSPSLDWDRQRRPVRTRVDHAGDRETASDPRSYGDRARAPGQGARRYRRTTAVRRREPARGGRGRVHRRPDRRRVRVPGLYQSGDEGAGQTVGSSSSSRMT